MLSCVNPKLGCLVVSDEGRIEAIYRRAFTIE